MNPDIQKLINETEAFIRHSLSEEQLAIAVYLDRKQKMLKYADKAKEQGDEELAKKFETMAYTFEDILAEEEVHVGQFREMLDLFNISDTKEDEGEQEGEEDIEKLMSGNVENAEMDLEQKIDTEENFINLLNKLNYLTEQKVDIKVKHPGILEIPEGKKFWQLPLSHYNNLIAKKGYGKIIKALTNLKTWNKNDDPKISERADKIINSLQKKHKVQENLIDNQISEALTTPDRDRVILFSGDGAWPLTITLNKTKDGTKFFVMSKLDDGFSTPEKTRSYPTVEKALDAFIKTSIAQNEETDLVYDLCYDTSAWASNEYAKYVLAKLEEYCEMTENLFDDVNNKRASKAINRLQNGDTVTLGDGQKVQVKDNKLVVIDKEGNELKKVDFNQEAMKELIFDYDGILEDYNYKRTNIVKTYSVFDDDADGHLSGEVVLYQGKGVYKWVDEEHDLEGPSSFSSARTAYTKFIQSLQNKVNNKQESFKALLTSLKNLTETFEIEFGDYKCFKARSNYRFTENDKNCSNCKYAGFEGTNFICTYLGYSRFPDREVKSQFTCDVWEKYKE